MSLSNSEAESSKSLTSVEDAPAALADLAPRCRGCDGSAGSSVISRPLTEMVSCCGCCSSGIDDMCSTSSSDATRLPSYLSHRPEANSCTSAVGPRASVGFEKTSEKLSPKPSIARRARSNSHLDTTDDTPLLAFLCVLQSSLTPETREWSCCVRGRYCTWNVSETGDLAGGHVARPSVHGAVSVCLDLAFLLLEEEDLAAGSSNASDTKLLSSIGSRSKALEGSSTTCALTITAPGSALERREPLDRLLRRLLRELSLDFLVLSSTLEMRKCSTGVSLYREPIRGT